MTFRKKAGGVLAPKGFLGAAVACGLKPSGAPDLVLISSTRPATGAGVFTTNRVCAAPVKVSRRHVRKGRLRAIVANSGNANACTGARGLHDAEAMAREAARLLRIEPEEVGVASTGVIGRPLDLPKVVAGIARGAGALSRSPEAAEAVARAILTTDTRPKAAAYSARIGGRTITVGGIAKGAGMIAPRLRHATMICFLGTDAPVAPVALQAALDRAAERTFNAITVDGDTSTNDTVLLLANGAAGGPEIAAGGPEAEAFEALLGRVCDDLAQAIVRDGEGATKFLTVSVSGAASEADAKRCARAIANSALVKTAMYGRDPNWGRIAAAAGYSGARLAEERLRIVLDGVAVVVGGAPQSIPLERLHEVMARPEIHIEVDLGVGSAAARMYTCDFSHEYVNINAHYTT